MKILISGGQSKFSSQLCNIATDLILIPLSKNEMDITDIKSIQNAVEKYQPDVFLHTAALSRPMDLHDQNPELSIKLNIIGTANCVNVCIKHNIKFVYISTDFVYPGEIGNYSEKDALFPVNKYAWSKLGGECVCMLYDNSLILRMAMVEKPFPHKKAFTDCFKSSIWYPDAASIVLELIRKNVFGVYNVGGEKKSIYDFAVQENFSIFKETKNNISENIPNDISIDISKLRKTLNDSVI